MPEEELDYDPIHFNDGCVILKDYVYIAAKYDRLDPEIYEYSIGMTYDNEEWVAHEDLEYNVISVCFYKAHESVPGRLIALSMQGEVHFWDSQGQVEEKLPDAGTRKAGKLGAMAQIRQVGASLFACGAHGQVYRRTDQGWEHIDAQILDRSMKRPLTLNGIGGSAEDDVFVVGYHGRILHFDGQDWTELESPTNMHLERVCSVGRGEAYAAGNEGTLLRITPEGIEDLSLETDEHFWGLTFFEGRVYAATLSRIYVFEGDELRKIDTGLGPDVGFYRLDNRDGMLWSFAPKDLVRFDGTAWERVPYPYNER